MRIINKHAFERLYNEFSENYIEIDRINDWWVKVVLDTGVIVEYLIYTELHQINKNDIILCNQDKSWVQTPDEEITNVWLEKEINILKDIYFARLKSDEEDHYAICYKDIVVGLTEDKPYDIKIRLQLYKCSCNNYLLHVDVNNYNNCTIHDFIKSHESVLAWLDEPWDFDIISKLDI